MTCPSSTPRPAARGGPAKAPGSAKTASGPFDSRMLRPRTPRSVPPWVFPYQESLGPLPEDQLRLLSPPAAVVQAQRNAAPGELRRRVSKDGFVVMDDPRLRPAPDTHSRMMPHFLRRGRASKRGRKWDHLRSAEPVVVASYYPGMPQPALSWRDFIRSSAWGWGRMPDEESQVVDYDYLQKLQPTFDQDVVLPPSSLNGKASRQRRTMKFHKRFWSTVMRHSLSPLLFRLAVMITSVLALGVAARIFQTEYAIDRVSAERTQSIVAVAVDCVAIPYIGYMIWDEYTGKPIGLRSGVSKMRLILLDLFFIIFKSASTALAFESLVYHNVAERPMLHLSTVLGVFELVGLVCWTMNFTVNIFRTVERLGGGSDNNV